MIFNVAQLLLEPIGATRLEELDDAREASADSRPTRIKGKARLLRTDRGILAFVRARLEIETHCSRCLRDLSLPVEVSFAEEFLPTVDALTGGTVRFDDAEGTFRIDERHTLDLHEALRQYRVTLEPMAPLCRDTCQGLCAGCGADLNQEPCRCPALADPRWQALRALVVEEKEQDR